MLIRKTTIVFAAAVALGFLTPVPDARSMKECSGRYHTPAKANARIQCGANASNVFSRRSPRRITLGIGDVVSVTIFGGEAGGLFLPSEAGARPGNFVTLPDQMVDSDGNITVPFAGLIKTAGRTSVQVQDDIVNKIKNRAIEPQAVVTLSQQRTSLISVVD